MKKFVLDFSTWRCGLSVDNDSIKTGEGTTCLLNKEGYSCCLGQFYLQRGVEPEKLIRISDPNSLFVANNCKFIIENDPLVNTFNEVGKGFNSGFADEAIGINDNVNYLIPQKLYCLDKLFTKNGFEFSVVNAPEYILDEYNKLKNNTTVVLIEHYS